MANSTNTSGYSTATADPNAFDLGKWLQSITQVDPNNQMQNWKGTANQDINTMPSSGLPPQAHDVAEKVLNNHYKTMAEQLITGNPDGISILSHLVNNTQPHSTMSDNINSGSTSTGEISPTQKDNTNQNTPKQVDPRIAALQQRQYDIAMQSPPGLLKSLLLGGAIREQNKQAINNLQEVQKSLGGEPLQQSEIDQAALQTKQKIEQALTVPPTQEEKLSNAAAYAGYKTTALKDMLDNTDKTMGQQNEIIKNMQGYSSWFNKPFGAMPKEAQAAFKKIKQLQLERLGVAAELNKHQSFLASGESSTSPFQEGQVYTDAQGNKATFKNGKFQ